MTASPTPLVPEARALLDWAVSLWQSCPETMPTLPRSYSPDAQSQREARMEDFLARLQAELRQPPRTRAERREARDRITAAFEAFARTALGLEDRHLEIMLAGGLSSVGTELARQARRFDPAVSTADILQANRNAWAACGLQMLLGRPMRLTPAIFAYSMLYPYSDNYIDDEAVPREEKFSFSARFGRRLAGESVLPANAYEDKIWRLIALIESEYDRAASPRVFESLLAIHAAQELSARTRQDDDILSMSFAKGGSSVLADGYLAAGSLTAAEARFVYAWGVLLQLADDLQDLRDDRDAGALSLFTQAAGREPLDALTNRTLHFGARVMGQMRQLPSPDGSALKELLERSSISLIVRSAGEAGEFYSPAYITQLEASSPFRFAFLRDRRARLARHSALFNRLFEAFLSGDDDEPAFPLLPSSLMPR